MPDNLRETETEVESPGLELHVTVTDEQSAVSVEPGWLMKVTRSVLKSEGVESGEISIALVDDATIHDVNRQFLNHDYPTDVISFHFDSETSESPALSTASVATVPSAIDGEVVISGQTARRSAEETSNDPRQELALYLVHGLLHLCGYDDQTPEDRRQMRDREKSHLQNFGICPNYDS